MAGMAESYPKLEPAEAKPLIKQLLAGVQAMHEKGLCHRDLKVTNLLVNRYKSLKLIDYGFATYYIDEKLSGAEKIIRKRLNLYCGTPSYMAPEMVVMRVKRKMQDKKLRGDEYSSEISSLIQHYSVEMKPYKSYYYGDKVDIWAVGVVIFKILTGIYAFGRKLYPVSITLIFNHE